MCDLCGREHLGRECEGRRGEKRGRHRRGGEVRRVQEPTARKILRPRRRYGRNKAERRRNTRLV